MKQFHLNRLLTLATFIMKVPNEKWDFSQIAFQGEKPMLEALKAGKHRCGSVACAIGWSPAAFPRSFKWVDTTEDGQYVTLEVLNRKTGSMNFRAAQEFFGITEDESEYLFAPEGKIYDEYYHKLLYINRLTDNSSPKAVANNIRRFVARKQKELKSSAL